MLKYKNVFPGFLMKEVPNINVICSEEKVIDLQHILKLYDDHGLPAKVGKSKPCLRVLNTLHMNIILCSDLL